MHEESGYENEGEGTHSHGYVNRGQRGYRDPSYREGSESEYRGSASRASGRNYSDRWEPSRSYRRGRAGLGGSNRGSESYHESRSHNTYARRSYRRNYNAPNSNRETSDANTYTGNQSQSRIAGDISYDSSLQSPKKGLYEDKQSDWSLHTSGRYYISNSSPWCYNQELGYFYFGYNGEIIYENSYQSSTLVSSETQKSREIPSEDGTEASKSHPQGKDGSKEDTVEPPVKERNHPVSDPFAKPRTAREISSEVVAQAMALSNLPLSGYKGATAGEDVRTYRDSSERCRHEQHDFEDKNRFQQRHRVSNGAEDPEWRKVHSPQSRRIHDSTTDLSSADEHLSSNIPNTSVASETRNTSCPPLTRSVSTSEDSSDCNIFDTDNNPNEKSTSDAERKSQYTSDLGPSPSHSSAGPIENGSERYYADLGAHYGYYCWDEKQKKYAYYPPDLPKIRHTTKGGSMHWHSDIISDHQLLSNYTPENYCGKSTLKLVVLSSLKLSTDSVVIVDFSGLTIGRSLSDGKNRLVIRDIELSRSHCSIHMALTLVADELAELDEDIRSRKNDSNRSRHGVPAHDRNYSEDHSISGSESGEIPPSHNHLLKNQNCDSCAQKLFLDRNFKESFFLVDGGSTRGTYLNDERLSTSKIFSDPKLLKHKDILKVGTTIFEVHLHPEWPCERCRITGTNLISTDIERAGHRPDTEADSKESWTSSNGGMGSTLQNTKSSLEKARLIELRRLKKRILDTSDESQNSSSNAPRTKYVDRAAIRRSLYKDTESSHRETLWDEGRESAEHDYMASSANSVRNVSSKCSSDLDSTIQQPNSESTGSKILKKMGWTEGQGLGAKGSGTTEPVSVTMRVGRAGLGSSQPLPSSVPAQKADCRYSRGWIADQAESISEVTKRRARERFYNI